MDIIVKTQEEYDRIPNDYTGNITISEGKISCTGKGGLTIRLRGDSQALAWGDSHLEAWGNSSVVAFDNAFIVAYGNSRIVAWGNTYVEAWDSSHIEALGNSIVKILSSNVSLTKLKHYAVAVAQDCRVVIDEKDATAQYIETRRKEHNLKSFLETFNLKPDRDNTIVLYKSVKEDGTDFFYHTLRYEGTVVSPYWIPDRCYRGGGGLHFSPTPELALVYCAGKIIKCRVALEDIVVYSDIITKVHCQKVEVIAEEI